MPRRDGTGPLGQGAMTGKGLGICNSANSAYGRGLGLGFGLGRGYNCRRVVNTAVNLNNQDILTEQKAVLEARLEEINNQLNKQ